MEKTYWGSAENLKVRIEGHQMTKHWENVVLELSLNFIVPDGNYCQMKTLIGALLSIF